MTIQLIPAGKTLAEGLSELYPNITNESSGISSDSPELLSGFSNPAATVSTSYKFEFDNGTSLSNSGMQGFVSDFVDAVAGGATLSSPLDSLSFQLPRDGIYAPLFLEYRVGALKEIETIVVLGDGIMDVTFNSTTTFEDELIAAGYNLTVDERAVSGNTIAATSTNFDQVKIDYEGRESKTLILLAVGVEDISVYPADSATIQTDYTTLMSNISNSGFMLMQSNMTKVYPPSVKVSQPYNVNVLEPLMDIYVDFPLDYYTLTEQNPQWFAVDGINPDAAGQQGIRDYTITAMLTTVARNIPDPVESLQHVVLNLGDQSIHNLEINSVNNTVLSTSPVYNNDYSEIVGTSFDVTETDFTGRNTSGRGNTIDPTNGTLSLHNNTLLTSSMFFENNPRLVPMDKLGLVDEKLYRFGFTASREVVASDRKADLFIGDMYKQHDASLDPATQIYWPSQRGIDLKGGMVIEPPSGNSFSYVGGIELHNEDLLKRNTKNFLGVSSFIEIPPWSVDVNHTVISFNFKFRANGATQYILDSPTVNNRIRILTDNTLQAQFTRDGGAIESVSSSALVENTWYYCEIHIDPSNVIMYVDGIVTQVNPIGGTLETTRVFTHIGALTNGSLAFNGEIANLNLNGEALYRMDEPSFDEQGVLGDYIATNELSLAGPELVVNGTFDEDLSGWTAVIQTPVWENGAMKLERASGQTCRASSTEMTCVIGEQYTIEVDFTELTAANAFVHLSISPSSISGALRTEFFSTTGTVRLVFTATQTSHWLILETGTGSDGDFVKVDNATIKRTNRAGIYNNFQDAQTTSNVLVQSEPTPRQIWGPNGTTAFLDIPDKVISGDYYVEFKVDFDGNVARPIGNTTFNSRILINADGSINWRPANDTGTALTTVAGAIEVGQSVVRVERIGSSGRILVDDISQQFHPSVPIGDAVFNTIHRQGGIYASSPIWDLDINGEDFYPMDDEWTDRAIKPARNLKLNQLITNGTFDTDLSSWTTPESGWTYDTGKAKLTGNGTSQTLNQVGVMTVGKTYTVIYEVDCEGSGEIGVANAGGTVIVEGNTGVVRHTFVADTTDLTFKRNSGSVTGTIDNIYLEERANYVNSASGNWTTI